MAEANDAFETMPRKYRPSYSYRHGSSMPHSTSMTFAEPIGDAWPSHHVIPPPMTDFPTDLATHRRLRAANIAANIAKAHTFNRRRTDTAFPRPDLGHSAPTVARSGLTASVSGIDISQPTPKSQRLKFSNLRRDNTPSGSRPSRIPTPVFDKKVEGEIVRQVSTPILTSQKTKKENVPPKTLRLLGPISPTRQQPPIPKSRTMGMLSSLTSSFSRSNLNLSSARQASSSSARTGDPTISISSTSSPPLPTFTTNLRQIHATQPFSYWCGRFQALADRFQNENMELAMEDPLILARYIPARSPSPSLTNITNIANNSRYQAKTRDLKAKTNVKTSYEAQLEYESRTQAEIDRWMKEEDEKRTKKVLLHLEALCVTNDAKKSLWEWQLAYARTARNEKFLPQGGRMIDQEKGGWVNRMGRAISGGMSTSGTMSSLSRRSGLGALGRRKPSMMGLGQRANGNSLEHVY